MYGRSEASVEQINDTTEAVTYLHHDQAGSTRLMTGSTGTVAGKCTYSPYGTPICEGTATTPLGYDAQYTSTDTGLIYMRARTYDPATAQFLTVDPWVSITGEPYSYASDSPINSGDPTGLCNANPFSESFWTQGNCLSEASNSVGLTPYITNPALVDLGAVVVCAVPLTAVACPGAIAVAFGSSTLGLVGQGICTNWASPGHLAAEEAINATLAGSGALGVKLAKLGAEAPAYAKALFQGLPDGLQGALDSIRSGESQCGCS